MKSGAELILKERKEQIHKHGRTIDNDIENNTNHVLVNAAFALIYKKEENFPENWDKDIIEHMLDKPLSNRLVIAGAFIAAEYDRIRNITKQNLNKFLKDYGNVDLIDINDRNLIIKLSNFTLNSPPYDLILKIYEITENEFPIIKKCLVNNNIFEYKLTNKIPYKWKI